MSFIKVPVKGMCDILPEEMSLREHVLTMMKETYELYGFSEISTPVIEHLENLTGKQGGDNEKLIFKVLKRGEALNSAMKDEKNDLADSGLRYDLTIPLARYYSNNASKLTMPFKSFQVGNVFRADKPQKGRFRQFMQCDIDILGDNTILAEVELIAATSNMLTKIFQEVDILDFTVHINDRKILKAFASYAGFNENEFDDIFISLDKIDKIGYEKFKEELLSKGYPNDKVYKFSSIFENKSELNTCEEFCGFLTDHYLDKSIISDIDTIINGVKRMISSNVRLMYDPALVRGMSYYTGTIFEISIKDYNFSIAGGGRYDDMIGKFNGQKVSACGFSIGFERIITILKEKENTRNFRNKNSIAILVDKNLSSQKMLEVFGEATKLRDVGNIVLVQPMNKNVKYQIDNLEMNGYNDIRKVYNE